MMPKTETSGIDTAEEWSTPLTGKKTLPSRQNGEEDEEARGEQRINAKAE